MVKKKKEYIKIPIEKYKEAIEKSSPEQRKYLYKEYTTQREGLAKREAKVELGVEKRLEYSKLKKAFRREDTRKGIKKREHAISGIARATGIIAGKQMYAGAGRPRGTYKYGVPIHVWKQQQKQKRALYEQYQQEQYAKLKPRGFTPEQIQQLQQQQALQELEYPQQQVQQQQVQISQVQPTAVQQIQERVRQMQQPQMQEHAPIQIVPYRQPSPLGYQKMKVPTNQKPLPIDNRAVDDELSFRKWSADTTVSPNTQRILDSIRRIQNKGKTDNIEQQRRIRERKMISESCNLMNAHTNMIDVSMDFSGVGSDNILAAPNIFAEKENNPHILKSKRFNILQTKEANNNLFF